MELSGKIALVSGGARGIGGAAATELARSGATVYAADILDAKKFESEAQFQRHLDVREPDQWQTLVDQIIATHGRLDVLVNAAGVTQSRSGIHDADLDEWHNIIAVNQTGVMLGMRAVIAASLDRWPLSIVNVSSIWGYAGGAGQVAYHASKGAVTVMTLNAAVTYADRNIRANAVLPGLIETEMVRDQDPAMRAETLNNTPMKRIGRPQEVGQAIAFLASDNASYITGVTLPVDGGFLAR